MGEPLQVSRAARGFPRRSRVRTALAVALAAAAVVSLTPRWWSDVAVLAGHWVGRFWLPLVLLVLAAAAAGGRHRKTAVAMVLGRRPGTPRMPLLLQVTLLLGLTFAVAVAAGALLWQVLGQPTIGTAPGSPPVGAPAPAVWSMQEALEAVKTVLTIVAGIGAVVALTVAYRRQRLNEVEAHREDAKLLLERFCQAAGLLGAPDASVRVAGVYAYAALANDAPEARQGCIDVLCTYLRQPYVPPSGDDTHGRTASAAPAGSARIAPDDGPVARNPRQERQVRLTIIRIIRDNLHIPEDDPRSWRGHDFDFTGAVLDGGDFTGATFTGGGTVTFADATIACRLSFDRCTFAAGTVSFDGARFPGGGISLDGVRFSGGVLDLSGLDEAYAQVAVDLWPAGPAPAGLRLPPAGSELIRSPAPRP
ncbi:hypothetical protein [Micromonospora oryzae]|uniref:hypothetical protein n=1 Tax=Micromonospora sp. DSM 102119 TaxID=3111768 RepID=UPI0031E14867